MEKHKIYKAFKSKIIDIFPGFLVALIVSLISIYLSKFAPKLGATTISIFLGMLLGNTFLNKDRLSPGYKFSETNLLSFSIVLLGATLSADTIIELGPASIIFIILQMTITLVSVIYIGKKLGFSDDFTYLMASGNAVCGSSAIAATAPVLNASEKDKGISITMVNVTGVVLMLLLPVITGYLYSHELLETSAMIGGTLQSLGQVVASGAMVNEEVKDLATLFKIVRIIFLVFVVLILGKLKQGKEDIKSSEGNPTRKQKKKIKVPWYVIGFFIACALVTIGLIPSTISSMSKWTSNKLEIIALAAIGLRVNFKELVKQGKQVSLYALMIGSIQIISAIILIKVLL